MTLRADLERSRDYLDRIIPDLAEALRHAHDWTSDHQPQNRGIVGGSVDPVDQEERTESYRVHQLATFAQTRIPDLVKILMRQVMELDLIVQRCTAIVDHSTLADPAECVSCKRVRIYSPVYEKAPNKNLCRWCYDHWRATGWLPPVRAVELYHRQSPNAAGRYITRQASV